MISHKLKQNLKLKNQKMSLKDSQLFFKGNLIERVENPTIYKEYSKDFNLDLIDYDLYNEDIQNITNIIMKTDKLTSLKIRLSNTLTDKNILSRLLRKITVKQQFTSLSFLIKYLEEELLSIFIDFLGKLKNTVNTLEITIKYNDKKKEEEITKRILESMIKNNNSGISSLKFKECRFSSEESLNLLNKIIEMNKNKLKDLSIYLKRFYNDIFTPDISILNKVDITFCNLYSIKYLPIEKLNVSYNNISACGLDNIIENLNKENCTLKKLNLGYNYLGNDGIALLGECFKNNKSLISLDVSGNNILNDGLISFANNISSKFNNTLKKLNFKDNSIDSDGIIKFCRILKDEPSNRFTKIDFRLNRNDKYSLPELGYFFGNFDNLNSILLANFLTYEAMNNFFIYCKNLSNLKKIIFLGINLTEESTSDLNELLLNNKNLEKLIIGTDRTFGSDGIIKISPGIEHNLKITHLMLPICYIGDEGAEILANALFKNIDIKEINLEENKIGEKGMKVLSEKVFGKVSLNSINLSHNLIDEESAKYLGESLKEATNLKYLILNSNKLMDIGCLYIAKGLEKNDSLIELSLDYNKISTIGFDYLSKVLVKKENIMKLSLSTNLITEINKDFYMLFNWLKTIVISDNPLKPSEIAKLFKASANNRLFKKLRFKINDNINFESTMIENDYLKNFDLSFNKKINLSLIKNILYLKNISKLNLQHNDIHDKDIQIILQYFKEFNPPLKELLIHSNLIGIEGSKAIAEVLKNNNNLKILNIANNPLLSEGINNILDSIINYKNILEEFLINYTDCGDYCINKIVNMLKNNKKLIVFSFVGNKFSNKGTDRILSTLRMNKTLKKLSLGSKYINSQSFINLPDYLSFNKTLLFLEIKSSKLGDNVLKKLSKVISFNKSIINIFLVENLLSFEGIVSFGQHVYKNPSINKIKVLFNGVKRNEESIIKSSNPHLVFN